MDYEKAYKEALERARANYKADKEMGFLENCDMLELIFPELRENEDVVKLCSNEWSEEDRKILNTIISDGSRGVVFDAKQVNFLKSLCPQYRWKPSEQEKSALRTAIHILTGKRSVPKAAVHLQNILDAFEDEEPRKDWKPTEEQMEALQIAATISKTDSNTLTSLLIDLKKLT